MCLIFSTSRCCVVSNERGALANREEQGAKSKEQKSKEQKSKEQKSKEQRVGSKEREQGARSREQVAGSEISNTRKPISCLGQVFNSKLGRIGGQCIVSGCYTYSIF